ncbi:HAMP domain-containing histidine kinase [Paenibacillus motobuensis]|uniref:sensor histidine kinase n=1 Tax=Paenibacillus TaxID=44249 RepID=UPI00203E211F|nr:MULTISPECIES: HAMP domain-containing sensor histidine kinase [Paenibacillus]MCM3039136.1 HAMP domain-containing histidine kinase [Paenibacillus lutimineralis]MCM3646240.1 HAMP domain-containing histidine kinase [Paenibacillus motobuensis]
MDGAARILRRFAGATIVISVFLLILNFILLGVWIFKGMNEGQSPDSITQKVAVALQSNASGYSLHEDGQRLLEQNEAWAMLINGRGDVVWDFDLPATLPWSYTLTEVAQFTRNYLMDYPVYVWEHANGLIVIGFPKTSMAKYQFNVPVEWVQNLPSRIVMLVIANALLALMLSLLIGSRLIKSIKPLLRGIYSLAHEQSAYVEPKGMFSSLAQSINHTSVLLEQKDAALKARDEARSNWIAGISHDIRTPLSMVLGYASDLEDSPVMPVDQRQQAAIIRQQGEKLRSLVSDLNLVSMLEYEMQPLHPRRLRLSVLARQIASDFLNQGMEDKFMLDVDISEEQLQVNGDEKLLTRAITNLVQNSIFHNPEGCHIILQTNASSDGQICRLIVRDDGHGVAENDLSDLLELPYSSRRRRPAHSGHGLGLPMVARIAKAHRGQLLLISGEGKGMEAIIELPAMI